MKQKKDVFQENKEPEDRDLWSKEIQH